MQITPPTEQHIQDLRRMFFDKLKLEYNNSPDLFHSQDVEKVRKDDGWLKRFLVHHENDLNLAFNMLWDSCEWRKNFGANEISESNINLDYVKEGGMFPYGFDKDGKAMLVFKCKAHIKGARDADELKRILVYWFERLQRQYGGDPITIFFDMTDTGLSNVDMDQTKFLINLTKLYYPCFVNYILIYEMPWVLNAAFKIIKSWLPARAVQRIKFINKSSIKDFVESKYILSRWGGEGKEYTFSFIPEVRIEYPSNMDASKMDDIRKKVHFAGMNGAASSDNSSSFQDSKSDENSVYSMSLLNIIHPDTVYFNCIDGEYIGLINIENISSKPVVYKIKTTSPDRFRVRPSAGIIQNGVSTKVTVVVQGGYQIHSILKDKFLVLSTVTDREDATVQEISEIWKKTEGVKVEQHRLKCSVIEPVAQTFNCTTGSMPDDLVKKMEELRTTVNQIKDQNQKLHKDVVYRQNLSLIAVLFLTLALIVLMYVMRRNLPTTSNDYCSDSPFKSDL